MGRRRRRHLDLAARPRRPGTFLLAIARRLLAAAGAPARVPGAAAAGRGGPAGPLRRRPAGAVLRVLGGDAHPVLLPGRDVGRQRPRPGEHHVRDLHDGRLAADAGGDPGHGLHRPGHHRAVHLRDPRPGRRRLHRHPEHLAVPRLRAGVRDQAAAVAVPRLAARRVPGRADPGDRAAGGGDEQGRRLRPAAHRRARVPGGRRPLRHPDRRARRGRHRLRVARGVAPAHDARPGRVLEPRAPRASSRSGSWPSTSRPRRAPCSRWSTTASWCSRPSRSSACSTAPRRTTASTTSAGSPTARPRMAGVFLDRRDGGARHPRLEHVRGRVLHPHRRLPPAPLAGGARLHRHRVRGRLHAAPLPAHDERTPAGRRAAPPSCAPAT